MSLVPGPDLTRPPDEGTKLTYDDLPLLPDDGMRHELIDGEHIVSPSPDSEHQAIVGNLHGLLWNYTRQHRTGAVFLAPFDIVLTDYDVVEPDILYISKERRTVLTARNVRGAPDLVVEVGSPSTRRRDERTKLKLYERSGISEYWIVDPDLAMVKVHRLTDGVYVRTHELSLERGDVLTTPLLPGLELTLSVIFDLPEFTS